MRKNLLFIVLLVSTSIFSSAQKALGYLGSKASLEANVGLLPLGLGIHLNGSFNYVVGSRLELGVRYSRFQNEMWGDGIFEIEHPSSEYYSTVWRYKGDDSERYNIELGRENSRYIATSIGLDFNIYTSDYIAPVGSYFQLGIAQISTRLDKELVLTTNEPGFNDTNGVLPLDDFRSTHMMYSMGFFDRNLVQGNLFFQYGLTFGLVMSKRYGKPLSGKSSATGGTFEEFEEDWFGAEVGRALSTHNFARLSLGFVQVF